jgi:hypothetical protein
MQREFFDYVFAKIQHDIENKRKVDIQEVFDEAIFVFFDVDNKQNKGD